ncbi:PAS domain-containing protein [Oceanicaulis alexandrii]|uniref:PAS domain-containing protein n=1 Tax=Oceanicaulis alexandrii TaxID=153233 RepID=UPI0035CEBBA4
MADDTTSESKSRRLLEAISEVQAIYIGGDEDAHAFFQRLLDILLDITDSEYGFVGEVVGAGDGVNPWLRTWAMTDISWDEASRERYGASGVMEFTSTDLLFASVLKDSQAVIANAAPGETLDVRLPDGHPPMTSFLGLPMMSGEELLGVAGVANRNGGYDPDFPDFLKTLTNTMGAFIKARRFEDAARSVQQKLAHSESRYALAIRGTGAGVWEWNADDQTQYWSPRLKSILGFPPGYEPPASRLGADFVHPEDLPRYRETLRSHMISGEPFQLRVRLRRADGAWITVNCHGQAERDRDGVLRRMVGTMVDVSDLADAEDNALKARLTAEVAISSANMGRWLYSVDEEAIHLDARFAALIGRSELGGKSFSLSELLSLTVPEDRDRLVSDIASALDTPSGRLSVSHRIIRTDGEVVWLQVDGAVIRRDEEGRPREMTGIAADHTPLRKAEDEANELRRLYELAITRSDQAVFDIDFKADQVFASPGYYEMLGHPQPSATRRMTDFLQAVHPDDLSDVQRVMREPDLDESGEGPHKQNLVFRLRRADGGYLWIEGAGEVVCDSEGRPERMSGTLRDITERRRIEQRAREAGVRAQMALRVAGLGVWELDVPQNTVRVDETLASILGAPALADGLRDPEELFSLAHPDDVELAHRLFDSLLTEAADQLVMEHRVITPSGAVVWIKVHIRVTDRDEDGAPSRIVGIVEDLSQQKAAEDTLKSALARAEAASDAKSLFLANMSHEIRTPLNGVLGIAQLLALTDLTERQKEFVQTIRSSGRALLSIIEDILDLSKIEAGKLNLVKRPSRPSDIISETCQAHTPEAARKALALTVNLAPELSGISMIDANRLRQVLSNLLSNAVKFTDAGTVHVAAMRFEGDVLRVEVRDTGPGLSETVQSRVFGRFEQADMSHSRSHEGSGLGLAIARELVVLMDGRIGVDSRVGEGACFWFEIPAPPANVDDAPVETMASDRLIRPDGADDDTHMRVLVVDDQPVNLDVTAEMVRQGGCHPVVAASGREALDLLQAERFDAVLMDLHMPGMGGEEAIRRIRAGEAGASGVPVYVISADATLETRTRVGALDVDGYFTKPVEMQALVEALNGLKDRPLSQATSLADSSP